MEVFLVRTVFCLLADNAGILEPRDIFLQFAEERTSSDGADRGPWPVQIFQVLNMPAQRRQTTVGKDPALIPHVNGELFAEALRIPDLDTATRQALLDAGQFGRTATSPAIFGALFQSVTERADRRARGADCTTEKKRVSARIAAIALRMMDHIMNNRLILELGQTHARTPIEKAPHIRNADALELDRADVLRPDDCSDSFRPMHVP